MDITSANTGLLIGVGNTVATLPTFISPMIVVAILDSTPSGAPGNEGSGGAVAGQAGHAGEGWNNVFYFLVACNALALVVYHMFVDTRSMD
jgi:hypothetical protein